MATITDTFTEIEQDVIFSQVEEIMQPTKVAGSDTEYYYGSYKVDTYLSPTQAAKMIALGANLDKEFRNNPQVISLAGHYMAKAQRQEYDLKTKRDFVKASISERLRTQSTKDTGKPFSETRIDSEMRRDRLFLQVSAAYAAAVEVRSSLEALFAAARRRGQDLERLADKETAIERAKSSYTAMVKD